MSIVKKSIFVCATFVLCTVATGCGPAKGMKKGEEGNISKDAQVNVAKPTVPIPEDAKKAKDSPTGVTSGGVPNKK